MNIREFKRLSFYIFVGLLFTVTGLVYTSTWKTNQVKTIKNIVKKEVEVKTESVVIYSPTKDLQAQERVEVEILQSESKRKKIQAIVVKNLEILFEEGLLVNNKIMPLNVYILEDNTVYVDFNLSVSELEAETPRNMMVIRAIVNSICELNVNRVKFMVNGKDGKKNLNKFYKKG
jgi:hypothetical protein